MCPTFGGTLDCRGGQITSWRTVMPSIDLVIFDNDGVVVDSELLANRVLAELLTEFGHPTTVSESVSDYMGGTLDGVRSAIRERSGQELPADLDRLYHDRLFSLFSTDLRPIEGVRSVLESLELPFCLASSGTLDRIVRSLRATGLLGYFEGRIFSAEQVTAGKPAPNLFLLAASTMGVAPSRCVVVEDSPHGVAAARAAGMMVLGYAALTPAARLSGADATFTRMDALPSLLERMSG
jgi:HAD superfamily hydrolase (TIGR01509 family)